MDMTGTTGWAGGTDGGLDIPINAQRRERGGGRREPRGQPLSAAHVTRTQRRQAAVANGGLATALGWFSIGLGLAEVVAPERVARLIGVSGDAGNRTLLRTMGVREIANGVAILRDPERPALLWARVAGDVLDLALLGGALGSDRTQRDRLAGAAAAVAGVAMLDVLAGRRTSRAVQATERSAEEPRAMPHERERGIHLTQAVTVNRPAEELYGFWRQFENLPRFMRHLEAVHDRGGGRSHWVAKAPAGRTVEWDAEIVEERPGELIAWRSLPDADVPNSGTVRFARAPGGRGTEVHVELQYAPPAGRLGVTLAKLFGEEPEMQVRDDLRVFKQVMETGEVVLSDGSLYGPKLKQRPGQPARDEEVARATAAIQVPRTAGPRGPTPEATR